MTYVTHLVSNVSSVFSDCLAPLVLTHELAANGSIRLLDLLPHFLEERVCWSYEPRGLKPLLSYQSVYSKSVKGGIVNLCFPNDLEISSCHRAQVSFGTQVSRLRIAEYRGHLLVSIAGTSSKKIKIEGGVDAVDVPKEKRNEVAVVPYLPRVSHGLKKIRKPVDVTAVFFATNKLSKLYRNVNFTAGGGGL